MHCTTLHAGLLSRRGTAGSRREEGRLWGEPLHCQTVSDGGRWWGTPAGLPEVAQGEEISDSG